MVEHAAARQEDRKSVALIAIAALIIAAPLAFWGPSCGHDFDFHLVSWLEAQKSWKAGIPYPHWASTPNYGAGEARFVFYPPLTWMLGAALGSVLPWNWTPFAFTLLCLLACGLSLYLLARQWLPSASAALAAAIYVASPYTLFNAYERTAYGELLSGAWLPLILLFALRKEPSAAWLGLSVAAVWLTNAPSAVMSGYLLAGAALLAALLERSWRPVWRAAWGQVLGMGIASIYIIPAAYEQRWVEITEAIGPGMRVEDSWIFQHTGQAFHDQVLHTASIIGTILLLLGIGAAGILLQRKTPTDKRRWLLPLLCTLPVILFLLFPASHFLWQHLPKLKFLQFPWRWLLVASMATAALVATVIPDTLLSRSRALGIPLVAAAALLASFATLHFYQSCDEEDAVSPQVSLFHSGQGVEGTDEYAPTDSDNTAIQRGLPNIRLLAQSDADSAEEGSENPTWSGPSSSATSGSFHIIEWQPESRAISIDSPQAGFAVLRLREYPSWEVQVNGRGSTARPHRADGLMAIPVPAGHSTIRVKWKTTADVLVARGCTFLACCCLFGTALWGARRSRQVS